MNAVAALLTLIATLALTGCHGTSGDLPPAPEDFSQSFELKTEIYYEANDKTWSFTQV